MSLPEDTYGLALYALDRSFSPSTAPATIDFQLQASPFATSRAKHAQIFNTAKKWAPVAPLLPCSPPSSPPLLPCGGASACLYAR